MDDNLRITHRFHVPEDDPLFAHRPPALWLDDVLGLDHRGEYEIPDSGLGYVDVAGSETVLRLVCTLLNQHAEQSPSDTTPAAEAERLEATIAAATKVRVPACPSCGGTVWKVDTDITNRAAIMLGGDEQSRKVWVDRCCPDGSTTIDDGGDASCSSCGAEYPLHGDETGRRVLAAAAEAIGVLSVPWEILDDYRQF